MIDIAYALSITGDITVGQAVTLSGGIVIPDFSIGNYPGPYVFTPTKSTQTGYTSSLICSQNITINPIPDNYIDTTVANGATASDILVGKEAYANGEYILGTAVTATATVRNNTLYLTDGFPVSV